jgi:hypothetical protein
MPLQLAVLDANTCVCSLSREERRRWLALLCAAGFRLVAGVVMQDYFLTCGCAVLLIAA